MVTPTKISPAILSTIDVFKNLSHSQCESVSALLKLKNYHAHQHIITLGDQNRDVYFIVSGTVRITTFTSSGKEVSFRDLQSGDMFGEIAAIDGQERSTNAVALSDVVIAVTPPESFFKLLQEFPEVNKFVLRQLTGLIRKLGDRVVEFSALSVKSRIHAELLRLAKNNITKGNTAEIIPSPTHQDIASRISTHREAVSREISELTKKAILKRSEGKLIVQDISELEALLK